MKKTPTLRVRPNPYFALDAQGMPAGIVRVDPAVGRPGTIEFIGATVRKTVIDDPENKKREHLYQRRATSIAFAQGAVEIPLTPYHVEQVRAGAVLADDRETARTCRIWFADPEGALKQAKRKAIANWRASHGEDPPVELWPGAVGPEAKREAPAPKAEELPLLRPWDAPIEPGASAPEVT